MYRIEIKIEGHLDLKWADWLEGFAISHATSQVTILSGQVNDQSGLYGIMAKLRDLGVRILSASIEEYKI